MQFLNPIWLWGFTGILIPIGIHLLSRKDGKIIKIGSVRHLDDANTRQFKSIRLNEIMLLAMRCLLTTLLVLLLSGLHFNAPDKKTTKWLLVEKGLERDVELLTLLSGQQKEFEIKSLAPGFPDFKDSLAPKEKNIYWNLIEDLKTRSLDHAVVLSYNYAEGFRGKRSHLPDHIQWISKDSDPNEFLIHAVRFSKDSISLRLGKSNPYGTNFSTVRTTVLPGQPFIKSDLDSISINASDTISIVIVSDSISDYDKKVVVAALDALKQITFYSFDVKTFTPDTYLKEQRPDWIFWLSEKPFTPSDQQQTILYRPNKNVTATNLFQQKENQNRNASWILTERLNEEIALREHLTVQLALILFSREKDRDKIRLSDKRILPEAIMWSKNPDDNKENKSVIATASGNKWIALLILLALVAERFIAFKRNQ